MSYMDGNHPDYETRWMNVDVVYVPYNIGGTHWIMVFIVFEEGELIVWDSFVAMTPLPDLEHALKTMSCIDLALICKAGVRLKRSDIPIMPCRIRRVSSTPQEGDGDCGIFCVKYFEYDITGCNMDTLTQDRMPYFRRQFAV